MKRSEHHILTTHAGSLPRPNELIELNRARLGGEAYNESALSDALRRSVSNVVCEQVAAGIQIPNDGEFGNATRSAVDYGAWASYIFERLDGFQMPAAGAAATDWNSGPGAFHFASHRRDEQLFAQFYADERPPTTGLARPVCVGPVSYRGEQALRTDLDNLRAAFDTVRAEEAFMTAVAPGSIEVFVRGQNRYYATDAAFVEALAEAMQIEYQAIVNAGFVLQIDDPGLPDAWDMLTPEPTLDEYRRYATIRVEALNAALASIPEDRVRYHICWGSWHGPHTTDIPLRDVVDLMLNVKAGAYVIEAGNVRHEQEWRIWEDVKLPRDKVLVPGVVSHATNVVEHPDLVADRLQRYAQVVGRENVIGGTDCGLGGRVHPQIAWAKLRSLSEGAQIATGRIWT
jgi:5-methyltetrahydropteroyltriglutamate--homocysteine methyltransferase